MLPVKKLQKKMIKLWTQCLSKYVKNEKTCAALQQLAISLTLVVLHSVVIIDVSEETSTVKQKLSKE